MGAADVAYEVAEVPLRTGGHGRGGIGAAHPIGERFVSAAKASIASGAHAARDYPRLPMPHSCSGPFSDTQMVIAFPAGATSRNVRVTIRASAIT